MRRFSSSNVRQTERLPYNLTDEISSQFYLFSLALNLRGTHVAAQKSSVVATVSVAPGFAGDTPAATESTRSLSTKPDGF